MRKLEFSVQSDTARTVFVLEGALTLADLFDIQSALRADTAALTVVDMTAVAYVDSAGIGTLVNAHVSRENRGRKLVLLGVTKRVLETMQITRVAEIFHFADDTADASATSA